jgi:hypothetical protein
MLNAKVKLADLKVKSFATVLDAQQQQSTQGGFFAIKGKKSKTDRFSWNVTIIDIRDGDYNVTGRRNNG